MKTTVVNIKKQKCEVYIGRPSIFGNPYSIGQHGTRAEVIEKFKRYFYDRLKTDEEFYNAILKLKGKKLGCFCVKFPIDYIREDKECHGEIILEYLERK
jgi:hypothetical protein